MEIETTGARLVMPGDTKLSFFVSGKFCIASRQIRFSPDIATFAATFDCSLPGLSFYLHCQSLFFIHVTGVLDHESEFEIRLAIAGGD